MNGSTVHWDRNVDKEVEIGAQAMEIIVGALETLNADKQLTMEQIAIYEKFCK